MNLKFGNDDEEFSDWRALAKARPWAIIEWSSIPEEYREQLDSELRAAAPLPDSPNAKYGLEEARVREGPHDLQDEVARFATANLQRLESGVTLEVAIETAEFALREILGSFGGLKSTFPLKRNKKWEVNSNPPSHQDFASGGGNWCNGARGDSLEGLFLTGKLPVFEPLWHASRILVLARQANGAIEGKDAPLSANIGIAIGESLRGLAIQSKQQELSGHREEKPKSFRSSKQARDEWLKDQEVSLRASGTTDASSIARSLESRLMKMIKDQKKALPEESCWKKISAETIRRNHLVGG